MSSQGELVLKLGIALVLGSVLPFASATTPSLAVRSLDGSGNNALRQSWGRAGSPYVRIGKINYADGLSEPIIGPPSRYVSNRIFNDTGQNLFSENDVSQWGWVWGQFIDHDFGLRDQTPGERRPIRFDSNDSLEEFTNDLGAIDFSRTPAATGTGETRPRQQINTLTSYIDASNVYGVAESRLDWLRSGSVDGNAANNDAELLLPDDYLPRVGARGDAKSAPTVELMGRLMGQPELARVAGDVRANENIALTSLHTLFALEHNRIVGALPDRLSEEAKFQIARRVVGAEIQWITYNEFLPALGVKLSRYRGYNPRVNPSLSNEFATAGYRAHSMIHGQFDVPFEAGTFTETQLAEFKKHGIAVGEENGETALQIPLSVAFGNPDLLQQVGLGTFLESLNAERQYRNDEQIDNTLRSVLFQIPKPGVTDPAACQAPVIDPNCFSGVIDLGAIDIERGRDHGMPAYNTMRRAYGLAPKQRFIDVTGESTSLFPSGLNVNDPKSLEFVKLFDGDGEPLEVGSDEAQEEAVTGVRRTTIAARLRAIYGRTDNMDAFVGMMAERHLPGSEFGELQNAIWKRQFEALRDGDRFFYRNDRTLQQIRTTLGISYRHTLAHVIEMNTDADVPEDVFKVADEQAPEQAPGQGQPKPRVRPERRQELRPVEPNVLPRDPRFGRGDGDRTRRFEPRRR